VPRWNDAPDAQFFAFRGAFLDAVLPEVTLPRRVRIGYRRGTVCFRYGDQRDAARVARHAVARRRDSRSHVLDPRSDSRHA